MAYVLSSKDSSVTEEELQAYLANANENEINNLIDLAIVLAKESKNRAFRYIEPN